MKVLLTGGRGMLGRTICDELAEFEIVATDLPEADITDEGGRWTGASRRSTLPIA